MDDLRIKGQMTTLVDQVEDRLLSYFKENDFRIGDKIPNELDLAVALGVARSVLREALSRLKMLGMIDSRTRRGMKLCEPTVWGGLKKVVDPRILSDESLFNILGFRIALETGICGEIFDYVTPEDIIELENIVKIGILFDNNIYTPISEFTFHSKLYAITRNKTIMEFQEIVHPVMEFVKNKFKDVLEEINIEKKAKGEIVTHYDLLEYIKKGDREGYRKALEAHFAIYKILAHRF